MSNSKSKSKRPTQSAAASECSLNVSGTEAVVATPEPHVSSEGLPDRVDPRILRTFSQAKLILKRDFAIRNSVKLKSYIFKIMPHLPMESLNKLFQGRYDSRFISVLELTAAYLENLATKVKPAARPIKGYLAELCAARDDVGLASAEGVEPLKRDLAACFTMPIPWSATSTVALATPMSLAPSDLWTPGVTEAQIVRAYSTHMDPAGIERLAKLSRDAVAAIAHGDFAQQLSIAEQTLIIGNGYPSSAAKGEALYLKGEASRLLADFESDRSISKRLRELAVRVYEESAELLKFDPRPLRGRARTIEVLGDLDTALKQFRMSTALAERQATEFNQLDHHSITHEFVRSLRHQVNCLAAIHGDTQQGTQFAFARQNELRRLLEESERRHRDALSHFAFSGDWWRIEWFMAEVLHAKGWTAIRELARAGKRLESALAQRLTMLSDEGALSVVEFGNFRWWAATAMPIKTVFEIEQTAILDQFLNALNSGTDRQTIKALGWGFLNKSMPAWMHRAHLPDGERNYENLYDAPR